MIDEHQDLNSAESYSTDSETKKNSKRDNNFITDEESVSNMQANDKNTNENLKKNDVIANEIKNNKKNKKNIKKKTKKNKKKKNEKTIEYIKKEKEKEEEEEERFHKYVDNFANKNEEDNLPTINSNLLNKLIIVLFAI